MTGERVRSFLMSLHDCWPAGERAALARFYHPDVVLLPPDLGPPIRGRDAVVDSYQEFLSAARMQTFAVTDLDVFEFPAAQGSTRISTYMAHLNFEISYELGGDHYIEQGLEIYTVLETGDQLQIVWRSQTVLDSRLASKSEPG